MGNHLVDHEARLDWAPIAETELVQQLLRVRARLHRLDIETARLLTEIEAGVDADEPLGGLVESRCRGGAPS